MPKTLKPIEATSFIFQAVKHAHEREPFVGGLFNAYEPAVHYEIFNAALAKGLDDTWQEEPLGNGQTTCDLVLPLGGGERLWLEVKLWWFLFAAYNTPYVNYSKTHGWPLLDWDRLEKPPKGSHRAVLLMRTWDGDRGKAKADQWLRGLKPLMRKSGAPDPRSVSLKCRSYSKPRKHERCGDLVLWSSTLA